MREEKGVLLRPSSSTTHRCFVGHEGHREADSWFETTQKLVVALKCIDVEMVNYGGLKLVGEASKWCEPTKANL
jgi:hypothetical protein